jgi:DNA polymerase/3'-5' exonuclease PolX
MKFKLLKKKNNLFYSNNLKNIGEFKENLVKQIFSLFSKFGEIRQIFIVGSFLTEKADYNDIDIVLITNKRNILPY